MDINNPWSLSLHDLFKRRNHVISLRWPAHVINDKNWQKRATKRPENIAYEKLVSTLTDIWLIYKLTGRRKGSQTYLWKPPKQPRLPSQSPVIKTFRERPPLLSNRDSGRRFYNFPFFFKPLVSPLWLISLVACQCIRRNLSDNMELQDTYRNFSSKK